MGQRYFQGINSLVKNMFSISNGIHGHGDSVNMSKCSQWMPSPHREGRLHWSRKSVQDELVFSRVWL